MNLVLINVQLAMNQVVHLVVVILDKLDNLVYVNKDIMKHLLKNVNNVIISV